jgi:hypothetical protein
MRGLGGDGVEEMLDPDCARPPNLGGKRSGPGQQRAGQGGDPAAHPV